GEALGRLAKGERRSAGLALWPALDPWPPGVVHDHGADLFTLECADAQREIAARAAPVRQVAQATASVRAPDPKVPVDGSASHLQQVQFSPGALGVSTL